MLISMAHLPLNTLPAFRAVARLQNLRAAADELHLTPSALSQQIKLLESQLGVQLFERRGRRLALNTAGVALQQAVEPALDGLAAGVRAAQAAASGAAPELRLTVVPSFAQRWLTPRIGRWREQHPDIHLDVHASQQVVDLQREGFHAALRIGVGPWRGLVAERLIDSALVAVAAPGRAARLAGAGAAAIAGEPLLGDVDSWDRWLALGGARLSAKPVAQFNDAGLLLQATEQDLGVALVHELPAADALRSGRLVLLSPLRLEDRDSATLWLLYPPALGTWAPLVALRGWLLGEMALSRQALQALPDPPAV